MNHPISLRSLVLAGAALLAAAAPAWAQTVVDLDESRSEAELRVDMRDAVERDTDVVNTALVFNNTSPDVSHVICLAHDAQGQYLARRIVRIPAQGVRYLRASDFATRGDFIGSATCTSRARIAATAVLLAPGAITNLDVIQADRWDDANRMRFPLIANY